MKTIIAFRVKKILSFMKKNKPISRKPVEKLKPSKSVFRVFCPKCGELMLKIYPYASFRMPEGESVPMCRNCRNKANNHVR